MRTFGLFLEQPVSTQAGHSYVAKAPPKAAVQGSEDSYCRALAALNASLWIPVSDDPSGVLSRAVEAFRQLTAGLLATA